MTSQSFQLVCCSVLLQHRFKTEVIQVHEVSDVGRWTVSYRSLEGDSPSPVTTEEFDFVMICNGLYGAARMPSYPGMSRFRGTQIHSSQYRDWTQFGDQTVLLVGIGNSACDIAMELSAHAKQVILISLLRECCIMDLLCCRRI